MRGAFTSAITRRLGRFELANNGTLFLDEIGDLPLDLQPKLLRVLEEQAFERIGSTQMIRTDVRVIAATNRPLEELMEAGEFRADLFYRLNVFPIDLSPLRERTEDIPPLVRHFVAHHARNVGRRIDAISPDVIDTLVRYPWPGNVRELQLQNPDQRRFFPSDGTVCSRLTFPLHQRFVSFFAGERGAGSGSGSLVVRASRCRAAMRRRSFQGMTCGSANRIRAKSGL